MNENFDPHGEVILVLWVYETDMQGVELQSSDLEEVCVYVCYRGNCHIGSRTDHDP